MSRTFKKLSKLRGRSFDEFRVRAAQMIAARAEQHGLSKAARLPDDKEFFALFDSSRIRHATLSAASLLDHFRARTSPNFFASFTDKQATINELQRRFGGSAKEKLICRANRLCEGRFDLLGLRDLSFGDPIDWHLEPVSGKEAPRDHWSKINYLDPEVAGDKKVTWELNRHQYFQTLGRAYWHTGDEIYAETFAAHLSAWMDANPPKQGINWASSLEVAFRAISWLWALYFFKDSKHLSPALFSRAIKFLIVHARHLETYLSTYFSPNTHLTGEALGLYYIGTLLPELRNASRWRATGERILLAELDRHVRPDGVYFEQSTYYHKYTTDFYTHFLLLAQANDLPPDARLEKKLMQLLDHLMWITKPDGTTPFFGDDDGGRLAMLDERAVNDFRSALASGAVLFHRADYKFVAGDATEETLWLTGAGGLHTLDELEARPPANESYAFTDGGYYVMRDGWTRDANYLLLDCGLHGSLSHGHAHADVLSFELAARGRTLLVDPGTYTYTGSAAMRDYFRHSAAHNTLTVDGESSSVPDGAFKWKSVAQSEARTWITCQRFDLFEGAHNGYARLAQPVTHERSILFLKSDYWIMRDHVESADEHQYDLHFHFAVDSSPALEVDNEDYSVNDVAALRERTTTASGLEIFAFGEEGKWNAKENGWVSKSYGERTPAPAYLFSAKAEGTKDFVTFLMPRGVGESLACVRQVEAKGGLAFEVQSDEASDDVLIGDGRMIATPRISSDFRWTWARYTKEQSVPDEVVLINGARLSFAGEEILRAAQRIGYFIARRAGEEWHVETDADIEIFVTLPCARRTIFNGKIVEHDELQKDAGRHVEYETV